MTSAELIDSSGRRVQLGNLIGRGGEGSVFAVAGQPSLAAKVYHQIPLNTGHLDKLDAMVACRTSTLDAIAAWPQTMVYSREPFEPCGILISRINDARPLHELYGTSTRRRYFPKVQWHHMVLAARNVAAAFDSLHEGGIIVGDVNQGNLLVDQQMCVRFIDCDSFQLSSNGRTFLCPVATPHFTPPELQSKNLRAVPRTTNHDCFGLAVLLFHLIFVGRHPFAGRFRGAGDMSIEKAIAERRFAFSRNTAVTLVEAPPFSLLLDDITEGLGELFERAFRGDGKRPTPQEWAHELDELMSECARCSFDAGHIYYSDLVECPWCRIEDEGGAEFFESGSTANFAERLVRVEDRLSRLSVPMFPSPTASQFAIPQAIAPRTAPGVKTSLPDVATAVLAVSSFLCLLSATSPWVLLAGTIGALLGGGLLLVSKQARDRREELVELEQRLQEEQAELKSRLDTFLAGHRQRQASFQNSVVALQTECQQYQAADTRLQEVLTRDHVSEKSQFLASHVIAEHADRIRGMSPQLASLYQSYGIESALDIDAIKLVGVPLLTPSMTMELMHWRERLEREFVFQPEHGLSVGEGPGQRHGRNALQDLPGPANPRARQAIGIAGSSGNGRPLG